MERMHLVRVTDAVRELLRIRELCRAGQKYLSLEPDPPFWPPFAGVLASVIILERLSLLLPKLSSWEAVQTPEDLKHKDILAILRNHFLFSQIFWPYCSSK